MQPRLTLTDSNLNRGASESFHQQQFQQPPQQHYDQHQQQYGQQLPYQQQHLYGPPPQQGYGAPPSAGQHLPPGWLQQWDQNSQRYYYLNQATGQTQWDPPVDQHRGFGAPPPGQHGYPPPVSVQHPGGANYPTEAIKSGEEKKDSNKNAMLAAGAGGLLVGGLAGAALAHDSDSDDGTYSCPGFQTRSNSIPGHASHAAPGGYGAPPAGYGVPPAGYSTDPSSGYGAPPPGDPQALEHNSDISGSQRESLEEARHDYEEAQREAADSDASSSEREEAQEAREEYQEEIEEAQEEAEDD